MTRMMTILATALLASSLLATAAEARGGGGFGHEIDRLSGDGIGHRGFDFRRHAMGEYGPGSFVDGCYDPDEAPKAPPWPPYCN